MVKTDEERKEKKRKYDREYYSRPEVKAKRKKYYSRPEVTAKRKEYDSRPEVKARKKELAQRPENKLKDKEYSLRPEVVKRRRELASRVYYARYRAQNYKKRENLKFKTYSVYSKRHSNSDIPCCRCCGENTDIRFLAVDHIDGRKNLPKGQKNLDGDHLISWLSQNNCPEGYQILCHNCNSAKGHSKDNKCPHEK